MSENLDSEATDFDLFGNPVRLGKGQRGRPPYEPTEKDRNKVKLLLALGCEIRHAGELVYADDLDIGRDSAFEPIGVSCRICDRRDCHQRAAPPLKRKLGVDFDRRDTIPYSFE